MITDFKATFAESTQLKARFSTSDGFSAKFGDMYRSGDIYDGEYVVTPKAWEEVVLETQGYLMRDDVTVLEIPYYETSNLSGGKTAIIGGQ